MSWLAEVGWDVLSSGGDWCLVNVLTQHGPPLAVQPQHNVAVLPENKADIVYPFLRKAFIQKHG